jgi:VanZ family protein
VKRIYGRIGAACWLLILPAKLARRFEWGVPDAVIDAAPSFLGTAGLLLVLLSNHGRLSRLTITQAWLATAGIALAAESAQLFCSLYRFDWIDVAATLAGAGAGALLAAALRQGRLA